MARCNFDMIGRTVARAALALAAAAAAACAPAAPTAGDPTPVATRAEADDDVTRWTRLLEEIELMRLQRALNDEHRPETTLIRGADVIDVRAGIVRADIDVVVEDGVVAAIGPALPAPASARVIDADGLFLIPGLADMHVHGLESTSQPLLNIAHGVTTVREMAGFGWLLQRRDQAAAGDLFAPSMIVAGPILNAYNMSWYAEAVDTPEAARAAVRAHAAAGYDAIKVHNNMPPEALDAIFDEARVRGLDVVGHIPHDVTVARAVTLGYRTAEHFKGYLDDRTLTITDEDWRAATRGSQMWNTPTLQAHRAHLRGAAAETALADPDAALMSPLDLDMWRAEGAQEIDDTTRIRLAARDKAETILKTLRPDGPRLLAGTDSGGGFPFMIYGRILIQEVQDFEALGLSPAAALRTATVAAAEAARRDGAFGEVVEGARADLVLLRANPLESADALLEVETVCLRGACLDRAALDDLLARLAAVHAGTQARLESETIYGRDVDGWLSAAAELRADGAVFRDNQLMLADHLLRNLDRPDDAARVTGWLTDPDWWAGR